MKWEIKDGVGYINIDTFTGNVGEQVKSALLSIDKATGGHPIGYVIDLRSNPGGLLDQAVDVADDFLDSGEIVSQRGRDQGRHRTLLCATRRHGTWLARHRADRRGHRIGVGNRRRSAPGSPPRTDHGRDELRQGIGADRRPDGAGFALRLTTARYYTPSGRSVQAGGINPDVEVPQLSDPDYKDRKFIREADLRNHLLAQKGVDTNCLKPTAPPTRGSSPRPTTSRRRASRTSSLPMRSIR